MSDAKRKHLQILFDDLVQDLFERHNPPPSGFEIVDVCLDIAALLCDKNRKYGNSALDPMRVFSKANTLEQIDVRIDDKLSRLKTSSADDNEDAAKDLLGYLVLREVAVKMRNK